MVLKARIIFSVLLLFTAFQGFAQVSFESEAELEKAANTFFDASDYAKAKPLFSQLLSKDALNPDYNYRFGVCILFTEADPMKPLPYIEGGASTKGVNVEAHYFLGKAFQLNYRFDDAIKSYEKGKSLGFSRPDIDLDRNIQECRNGKILYNPAIDFQPAMDKDVIASEFYRPYDFRKLKGKVIPMPSEFKTKYDEKNLTGTVIYTPTNSQTLIYASYGEDGANAKDLYRVNRLPNGELALPLRLPNTINTKYDEDYAFYDEESQMLFFASKGHNSMGGYDVFSSKYDANNSTWSTPLNLQYPINSPFDDFLYVSDPEGKVAFFTTDRNVEAGKLRVMKTLLHDPQQVEVSVLEGTFVDKTDSIYNYAALTVLDPITNEVVGKYRSHKVTGKYLLILPPQNDYTMDVGPREANGFKFDLDVPKHEAVSPLQQKIVYDASSASGTITLTNYFDATGNPDTVKFIENRSLKDVEERMVAMPDPSEILAANSQVDAKKKEAEQKALTAVAAEKAKQDAVKKAEESALKEKQTAEEFAKQAELAKAEQARLDAIREAEKQAFELAEKEAATKATQDELAKATQAEELALKEKQTAEEFAKQAELAKAEQARLDAIREAEKQAFELVEKEAAAKAKQAKELDFIAQAREDFTKDSIRQVEEFEKLHASHMEARAKRDSVNKALELAKLNEAGEQAKRDSIVELELKTEQDKLAQIQLLKSQQDFLTQTKAAEIKSQLATLEAEEEKSNSQTKTELPVSEVVEAKPEKSTASIQKEEVNQTVAVEVFKPAQDEFAEVKNTKVESKDDVNPLFQPTSEVKLTVDSPATEPVIELAETEVLSESELFLQTIAKLEAQKRDQEQLVVTENAEKKKAQEEKKLAQAEAKRAADTSSVKMQGDGSVEGAIAAETEPVVSDTSDVETMSMALKSDANPQEYLIALAEIEKKIAKEAAANINKSYELKELPSKPGVSPNADPVLQSIMESDREALTAHQKIAVEKEKALKEQMKRDKGIVELAEQVAEKELEIIENEIVQKLDVRPTLAKEELVLESKKAVVPESKSEIVIEPVKVVEPVRNIEVAEQKQTVTEVPKKNEVDQEVLDALAEFDRILAGSEKPEIATGNVESKSSEEKAEVSEVEINEPEVSISSEPVLAEEVVVEKTQLKEKEEKVEVNVGDEVSALSEKEIIEEVVEIQQEEVKQGLDKPKQASTGSVGTIPFLTAAKRSYSTAKPSFEKIEDVSMRRMVQRMRAEDVGRMAVLKNMKNEWVDAGKSDEALKEIKGNTRNQDVLESVAAATSREEYIRPPFDTNTLRKRKDVYYKLDFRITTAGVSQTVSESMTPEQAMSFAMPEFDLKDGFYHTLADVTSDLKEYQRRGFDSLRIIPFLKNEQVTLSDVTDVPFVD